MSKQVNIRIPDDVASALQLIADKKNISLGRFVSDAISLALSIENNMGSDSRLVIENAKDTPKEYKLLIRPN